MLMTPFVSVQSWGVTTGRPDPLAGATAVGTVPPVPPFPPPAPAPPAPPAPAPEPAPMMVDGNVVVDDRPTVTEIVTADEHRHMTMTKHAISNIMRRCRDGINIAPLPFPDKKYMYKVWWISTIMQYSHSEMMRIVTSRHVDECRAKLESGDRRDVVDAKLTGQTREEAAITCARCAKALGMEWAIGNLFNCGELCIVALKTKT